MRKTVIAAALALAGAAGAGAALAQSAPQAPAPGTETQSDAAAQPGAQPRGPHEMRMGWWHHHQDGHGFGERGRAVPFAPGTFGLFAPQADKHLSPADVQEIAQAILLWNGNHDWKVAQVQPGENHQVTFAYVTQDGATVAKFAINQDTGRITRLG